VTVLSSGSRTVSARPRRVLAAVEELLGRQVHKGDAVALVDHDDRRRKRVQDRARVATVQQGYLRSIIHVIC
jgi:hypothetical protein